MLKIIIWLIQKK